MDITTEQYARLWGYSVKNIRRLLNQGKLPGAYKIKAAGRGLWLIPMGARAIKDKRGPRRKGTE